MPWVRIWTIGGDGDGVEVDMDSGDYRNLAELMKDPNGLIGGKWALTKKYRWFPVRNVASYQIE